MCRVRVVVSVITCAVLSSCGFFDSDVMWRGGPYQLVWIDTLDSSHIGFDLGNGASIGRIESTVYSVGWDGKYLVAKQHPKGDKGKVNYFYIDSRQDSQAAEPASVVVGPLSEAEFVAKSKLLGLPVFSKTVGALE
jgi:hypothetical protein